MAMEEALRLRLLGGLRVTRGGGEAPVAGFVSRKAQALLGYLAVTGRPHSREALATLLWGETSEAAACLELLDRGDEPRDVAPVLLVLGWPWRRRQARPPGTPLKGARSCDGGGPATAAIALVRLGGVVLLGSLALAGSGLAWVGWQMCVEPSEPRRYRLDGVALLAAGGVGAAACIWAAAGLLRPPAAAP